MATPEQRIRLQEAELRRNRELYPRVQRQQTATTTTAAGAADSDDSDSMPACETSDSEEETANQPTSRPTQEVDPDIHMWEQEAEDTNTARPTTVTTDDTVTEAPADQPAPRSVAMVASSAAAADESNESSHEMVPNIGNEDQPTDPVVQWLADIERLEREEPHRQIRQRFEAAFAPGDVTRVLRQRVQQIREDDATPTRPLPQIELNSGEARPAVTSC